MTIEDNIIKPYKIVIDDQNHTLFKTVQVEGKEDREVPVGYYTSVESCLKKILRETAGSSDKQTDLIGYIDYYKQIFNTMYLNIKNGMANELVTKTIVKQVKIKKP